MPKTDTNKAARKDEAAKEKRTKAEVAEAAVARLREKLEAAEERAEAAKTSTTKQHAKLLERTKKTLALAFSLAEKAGVVLAAANTDGREWAPEGLSGRLSEFVAADGKPLFVLHTTGKDVPLEGEEDPDES